MIDKIYNTEIKYKENFCKTEVFDNYIRFIDDNIMDMYSHNFTYIKPDISEKEFCTIVSSEIKYRMEMKKPFLKVVTSFKINPKLLKKLPLIPNLEISDYFCISTDDFINLKEKENAYVVMSNIPKVAEHGRIVDIVANYENMSLEFAIRRIDRKFQIYSDKSKPINLYVCYNDIEPVGNCELMINHEIAKIEDFDIIKMHQRKGFGSHMLRSLLKICNDNQVEQAYLITDHNDTAKEMYAKCGFKVVGNSTEMMFHLK